MRLPVLLALLMLGFSAAARADFACIQECASQGYDRSRCVTLCERGGGGGPGLIQQPGAPRNPYFDSLSNPVPQQQLAPRIDPTCLDDCRARGYKYQFCRKQCSY